MPRILELKQIDGAMWARLDPDPEDYKQPVYVWTRREVKADRASAIRSFVFALANQYIESEHMEDKP